MKGSCDGEAGDSVEIIDSGSVQEAFVYNLESVENLGSISRLIFCVPHRTPGGVLYKEVAFKMLMPTDQVPAAVVKLAGVPRRILVEDQQPGAQCH